VRLWVPVLSESQHTPSRNLDPDPCGLSGCSALSPSLLSLLNHRWLDHRSRDHIKFPVFATSLNTGLGVPLPYADRVSRTCCDHHRHARVYTQLEVRRLLYLNAGKERTGKWQLTFSNEVVEGPPALGRAAFDCNMPDRRRPRRARRRRGLPNKQEDPATERPRRGQLR
jgi:hypothetical protein